MNDEEVDAFLDDLDTQKRIQIGIIANAKKRLERAEQTKNWKECDKARITIILAGKRLAKIKALFQHYLGKHARGEEIVKYEVAVRELEKIANNNWRIGEIADSVEPKYGEGTLQQLAEDTGIHYEVLKTCRTVWRAYNENGGYVAPVSSWNVCKIFQAQPDREALVQQKWTVAEARAEVAKRRRPDPEPDPEPEPDPDPDLEPDDEEFEPEDEEDAEPEDDEVTDRINNKIRSNKASQLILDSLIAAKGVAKLLTNTKLIGSDLVCVEETIEEIRGVLAWIEEQKNNPFSSTDEEIENFMKGFGK